VLIIVVTMKFKLNYTLNFNVEIGCLK